ncbi:MAG: efflux RND transporter periplasmic adaptor subunit [Planctomycetota bacterium]|nr:efflux RND transporter periplasmic adaptor subunit [Planctomycetota bacterium]MDA1211275.1 efflux RND transporter periplasmic adaptor subunit [Planctomycetota bacterium]
MSQSIASVPSSPRIPLRVVILALMLSPLQFGCDSSSATVAQPQEKKLPTIQADVLNVTQRSWPTIVRSQGNLIADEMAVVGSKVAGRVARVHVDLGDIVKAGSPLITLDENEFRLRVLQADAQLTQARSAVGLGVDDRVENLKAENSPPVQEQLALWDEAKANLERMKKLQMQKAVTLAEVEQIAAAARVAEARYASALNSTREKIALIGIRQAELSLARQQLDDVVVRMPFDGLVQQRDVAPGAYVQVGNPVVTVVRTNPLRFRGAMAERLAQNLAVGQKIALKIESLDEPRMVTVARISPALNRMNRSLTFEADVKNEDHRLRAGLFAEADVFIDPQAQALVVPASAIVEFAGAEKVWKVIEGKATEHEVLTGARRDNTIEILKGLAVGDVILVDGMKGREALIDPQPVPESSHSLPPPENQAGKQTAPATTIELGTQEVDGDEKVDESITDRPASVGGESIPEPVSSETAVSE